jgi:glyoxylase-like metal-dependent hydrolase (beta-lactamase superfamily II)
MKRALKWSGLVLLLLALAAGGVFYSAFAHNIPIEDGNEPAPGVRAVKDGFVSVYFLDAGAEKVALVDAGHDPSGQAIIAELNRRKLGPSAVTAIFLTHGHRDHTAACQLFPDATVYALDSEIGLIGAACKVGRPLHDGEAVTVGDLRVEAFAVPGHTPGSAAYLARGVLFLGDSANGGRDGKLLPAVRFFSKDPAQNVASLKALAERLEPRSGEIKTLACAHSGPLEGFAPLRTFAAGH